VAPRSRRNHSPVRRTARVGLTFTPEAKAAVQAAARRNGMATAAWAAQVVLDRAEGRDRAPGPGPELLAAAMALVAQMQAVGNNLNQSVRQLNATGQRPGHLAAQAAQCMDLVDQAHDLIEAIRPERHW
jgi:hypothetical protein